MIKLSFILYLLFILSYPFYLFEKSMFYGSVQPWIFFILAAFVLIPLISTLNSLSKKSGKYLLFFVFYTMILSVYYYVETQSIESLKYIPYYIFAFISFSLTLFFVSKGNKRNSEGMLYVILFSVITQLVLAVVGVGKDTGMRSVIFFNNPNQLAYFSVLSASLAFAIQHLQGRKNFLLSYIIFSVCVVLNMYSLSNAGFLGLLSLLFVEQIRSLDRVALTKAILVLVIGGVTFFAMNKYQSEHVYKATVRVQNVGKQSDDTFEARGLTRIVDYPEYLVMGAGEGNLSRFNAKVEIHNTLISLLFCYGIVGFMILTFFVKDVLKGPFFMNLLTLIPPLVYGIAHNGIRSPLLWALLAVIAAQKRELAKGKKIR